MGTGSMSWENHYLESNYGLTLMQIENSCSLSKFYIASLVDACTHGQEPQIWKSTIAQNREENKRKEREKKGQDILAYFEGAREEAVYTVSRAASGEGKKQHMWCSVYSQMKNTIISLFAKNQVNQPLRRK